MNCNRHCDNTRRKIEYTRMFFKFYVNGVALVIFLHSLGCARGSGAKLANCCLKVSIRDKDNKIMQGSTILLCRLFVCFGLFLFVCYFYMLQKKTTELINFILNPFTLVCSRFWCLCSIVSLSAFLLNFIGYCLSSICIPLLRCFSLPILCLVALFYRPFFVSVFFFPISS